MVPYFGDFAEDATVRFTFNTFSSDDPSASVTITDLADADLKVHKDGSTTQIVTDGATIAINFDSITGNHMVTVDTSAHADYSTGSDYHVRMEGTTVDGATINAFIGHFSIENRYNAAADDLANGTDGLGALKALIDTVDGVVDTINTATAGLAGAAMRGTDSAALAANYTAARAGYIDNINNHTAQTADHTAAIADIPTVAEFNARTLVAASYFDPAADTVATVTQVTGGINTAAGTITTLDGLDTAQDTQHTTTQDLVSNLSVGSGGISVVAESFTKAGAEPETNTYAVTDQLDGVLHTVEDDATATDVYYQFDITPNGVPIEVEWDGYAQSQGDSYTVHFYNWTGASWDQVATLDGTNGTTVDGQTFNATVAHVGTGANDGKVRLRFLSSDGTAIVTDRILCTYTVVNAALGYEMGGVWVDEVAGTSSGTTPGVDGLVTNRSDDFDNAQDVADTLGYTAIYVTNGNTITLSDTINNFSLGIPGGNWSLALGGQDIGGCDINDADVTGIGTGTTPHFHNCTMGAATIPPSNLYECAIGTGGGTLTLGSAGAYRVIKCVSDIAGASSPVIDCTAGAGNITMELRQWSGGVTLNGLKSGDVVTIGGVDLGTVTLNGADASVEIRGVKKATVNNLTGSPTVNDTALLKSDIDSILVDSNELQGDWTDGGRLDLIIDELTSQGDTNETAIGDLQSRTPAALVSGRMDSNVSAIDDSNPAATALKQSSLCVATGTVATDGSNSDTAFQIDTTLGAKAADYFGNGDGGAVLSFVAGTTNEWQSRRVIAFNTTTDFITVEEAFSATPADDDAFVLLGRITELT